MRPSETPGLGASRTLLFAVLILAATAAVLLAMGRHPICTCGAVRLWADAHGPENSQQLLDWYAPSHVVHGLLFYAGLRLWGRVTGRPLAPGWAFLAALGLEGAWEIVENTPVVVAHYRSATIAQGYEGDSVLNSLSDMGAMAAGFALARRLPATASVALALALELAAGVAIRDNLTLNVLMLLHPIPAIKAWQGGA
jgi:hypothetical protein